MPRLLVISREDQILTDLKKELKVFDELDVEVIQHVKLTKNFKLRAYDVILINAYRATVNDILSDIPLDVPILVYSTEYSIDLYENLKKFKCIGYVCSVPYAFTLFTILNGFLKHNMVDKNSVRVLKKKGTWMKVDINDIMYINTEGNNSVINFKNEQQSIRIPITKLLEHLDHEFILRTHRQYAVNIAWSTSANFQDNFISINNLKIPIGRSYKKEVKKIFKEISINKKTA